jgi:hypothetical protein
MDTEALARKALAYIKERYGLPSRGFLAGGSLANVMWHLHTGKPGPINDIDVFVMESKSESFHIDKAESLFGFTEKEKAYYEDYTGLSCADRTKNMYSIKSSENEGIFNTISYESSTEDPEIILKAFDLNCVKVGYHIDSDRVICTDDFEEFLSTGKIKITNLMTPSHSPLRIAKKAKELYAEYDEMEMRLATYALSRGFTDVIKSRFKERYAKMYEDSKEELEKYFEMKRDEDTENWLLTNGIQAELYCLVPTRFFEKESESEPEPGSIEDFLDHANAFRVSDIFDDDNLAEMSSTREVLFYIRNVYGTENAKYWKMLKYFYRSAEYLDGGISQQDAEMLSRIAMYAPKSIESLSGMSASEQASMAKSLLEFYREDPIVAIAILEKGSFKGADLEDELTRLLLELGVRKEILSDSRGKASRIFGEGK